MIPEEDKIRMINNIKTTMEIENQVLTDRDIAILSDFADNKITMEDAINEVRNMVF